MKKEEAKPVEIKKEEAKPVEIKKEQPKPAEQKKEESKHVEQKKEEQKKEEVQTTEQKKEEAKKVQPEEEKSQVEVITNVFNGEMDRLVFSVLKNRLIPPNKNEFSPEIINSLEAIYKKIHSQPSKKVHGIYLNTSFCLALD